LLGNGALADASTKTAQNEAFLLMTAAKAAARQS
jgi:hypothetical protein